MASTPAAATAAAAPSPMNLRHAEQWRQYAACKGMDTALFFPEHWSKEAAAAPRAICHRCPVRIACLDYALAHNDTDGMFGGKTPSQRRRIRQVNITNNRKESTVS